MTNNLRIVFFGTDEFAVGVLSALEKENIKPTLIITTPDKPKGRKLTLTPPPVKIWAGAQGIPTTQPTSLKEVLLFESEPWDLFIVASYGKIIPQRLLDLPKHGPINIHPSLLPEHRGATPLEASILHGGPYGVTLIKMDAEVDHGPIIAQEKAELVDPWYEELRDILANHGGELLARILPDWVAGKITPQEQDHAQATFTKKITKADGEISLDDDPGKNYRKIRAYTPWPGAYFFTARSRQGSLNGLGIFSEDLKNTLPAKQRVIIKKAQLENGALILERVVPEGKKEMNWSDFSRNI